MKEWPGQVVLCTSQIFWTLEVHKAIKGGADVGFYTIYDCLSFMIYSINKIFVYVYENNNSNNGVTVLINKE